MNDEEVAFRIVRLYFEEIARLGFKRQLDLDQIINAYFYALKKLENKEELTKKAIQKIVKEEQNQSNQNNQSTQNNQFDQNAQPNQNIQSREINIKTETTNVSQQKEPRKKTITEILEEK